MDFRLDARILLEHVCNTNSTTLYANGDRELSEMERKKYEELINKRVQHVPLQHLTGIQGFMGLDFKVNRDVLIPRQDTETLVEEVLRELHDGMSILDMCIGSGCILLSLLYYSNECSGLGADLSEDALKVAKENAKLLGIDAEFIQSDLFSNINGKFDVIVSNPPYIKTKEIEELMPEVRDYEPFMALDGKEDGLSFYVRIIEKSVDFLYEGGLLAFEIGCEQGEDVSKLMRENGFTNIEVIKDLCGLDRVVKGRKKVNV